MKSKITYDIIIEEDVTLEEIENTLKTTFDIEHVGSLYNFVRTGNDKLTIILKRKENVK